MLASRHPLSVVARAGTVTAAAACALAASCGGAAVAAGSTPPDTELGERVITTIAGTGEVGVTGDGGPARQARLGDLSAVAAGPDGTVYVAAGNRIRAISPDGTISRFAGTGERGSSGDGGPATEATLTLGFLTGLAVDAAGTVYIVDRDNHEIRAVAPDGTISTVAGNGREESTPDAINADGVADPRDVAVGPDGVLYVTESDRVQAIDDGVVTTIATGGDAFDGFDVGDPIAVDRDGAVYVTDSERLLTVDGNGELVPVADLPGAPRDLAVDGDGVVYAAVIEIGLIEVDPDSGDVTTVVDDVWPGNGDGLGDGGPADVARLYQPTGVAVGSDGSIFVADSGSARVRAISPGPGAPPPSEPADVSNGRLSTWIGDGGDGLGERGTGDWWSGPTHQLDILLSSPSDVAIADDGTAYVADTSASRILAVDRTTGDVSTVIDHDAVQHLLPEPFRPAGLALGGNLLYVVDERSDRVVRYRLGDGDVDDIAVDSPTGIAVDGDGTAYVGAGLQTICRIEPSSGTCETFIDGADGREESRDGLATDAALFGRRRLDLAVAGDALYVADAWFVRAIDLDDGAVTMVAGTGIDGPITDGAAALDTPIRPSTIAAAPDGSVYFVDHDYVLRVVTPDARVHTLAGTDVGVDASGPDGYVDEDPATPPPILSVPLGLGTDADGNLYVADEADNVIRVLGNVAVPAQRSTTTRNAALVGSIVAALVAGGCVAFRLRLRLRRRAAADAAPRSA